MDKSTANNPTLGTWTNLPTEPTELKPSIKFEVNIPVEVTFIADEPRELMGETGAYYIFDVVTGPENEEKVIMTSAWTLLRTLKTLTPLKDKKVVITKKLIKGKQQFIVEEVTISK